MSSPPPPLQHTAPSGGGYPNPAYTATTITSDDRLQPPPPPTVTNTATTTTSNQYPTTSSLFPAVTTTAAHHYPSTASTSHYPTTATSNQYPTAAPSHYSTSSDDESSYSHHRRQSSTDSCHQRAPLLPSGGRKPSRHQHSASDGGAGAARSGSGYHDGGPAAFLHTTVNEAVSGAVKTVNGAVKSVNGAVKTVNGLVKIQMPAPHRDEPRFPREPGKTALAAMLLALCAFLTTTSLAYTHEHVPQTDPLPDVILDSLPMQEWGLQVSEFIIVACLGFTFLVALLHKHRLILARRVFLILSLLYLYRAITMAVTVLPVANPNYYCSPKLNATESSSPLVYLRRSIRLLSGFGLSINGQHTYCGDYIFSGHTSVLLIFFLIVLDYTPRSWWLLHWCYGAMCTTGVAMVLIARGHYTIDCVIAYFVTSRLWYMYHAMANNAALKEWSANNSLSRLWWFPLMRYFEGNVGGVVPRHYEWPLPFPRGWGGKTPHRTY